MSDHTTHHNDDIDEGEITALATAVQQSVPALMDELGGALSHILTASPEHDNVLGFIWDKVQALQQLNQRQHALMIALHRAAATFRAQRDLLAQELAQAEAETENLATEVDDLIDEREYLREQEQKLLTAIRYPYNSDLPQIKQMIGDMETEVYEQVFDEAFTDASDAILESLPYDLANQLGDDWQFWQADTLHTLLTIDMNEVPENENELGFTRQQVIQFRAALLVSVNNLTKGDKS